MALNAREYKTESKFKDPEPLEVGGYPARVVQVISLGLQEQDPYQGKPKDPKQEVRVVYELSDEFLIDEDGNEMEDKPRWQAEEFTMNSLDSDMAKSTKRYYAIDPEEEFGGDWTKLLGMPCMVNITQNKGKGKHEGRIFNNIGGVNAIRAKEAKKMPELANEPLFFDVDDPDLEVFLSLPQFVQDKIKGNLEFEGSPLERLLQKHKGADEGDTPREDSKATDSAPEQAETASEEDGDW